MHMLHALLGIFSLKKFDYIGGTTAGTIPGRSGKGFSVRISTKEKICGFSLHNVSETAY